MPSMTMSPIHQSTVDSALLELSRTTIDDMKEMNRTMLDRDERFRREALAREDMKDRERQAREDAKDRERLMALQIEQLRQELSLAQQPRTPTTPVGTRLVPQWSVGGWVVRLAALALVLRWRPLFKLLGRLADI